MDRDACAIGCMEADAQPGTAEAAGPGVISKSLYLPMLAWSLFISKTQIPPAFSESESIFEQSRPGCGPPARRLFPEGILAATEHPQPRTS